MSFPESPNETENQYKNPYSAENEPERYVAFQEGLVMALRAIADKGRSIHFGIGTFRALSDNEIKQLATDQSWLAINAAKKTDDTALQERTHQILASTEDLPYSATIPERELGDTNG